MHFQFRDITENRAPAGDIVALGGETRHAQAEPRGVLCADEERERAQVLLRRARGCEADHAELKRAMSGIPRTGLKMTVRHRGEKRREMFTQQPRFLNLSALNVREENEMGLGEKSEILCANA